MHEMSLVQGLFTQLRDLARDNNASKVITVTMEIGPVSGVVIDSFRFGFEALATDDPLLQDAELIISVPPVEYSCSQCGHSVVTSSDRPELCARCNEPFFTTTGGDDCILQQVELE